MNLRMVCLIFLNMFWILYPGRAFLATNIESQFVSADYLTKEFHFLGNVHLSSPNMLMQADELIYSPSSFQAKGNLRIERLKDGMLITAEQLERTGSQTKISSPGGRVLSKDEKKDRTIESDSVMLEKQPAQKGEKIYFLGNPSIVDKQFKGTAENGIIYDQGQGVISFMGTTSFEDFVENNKIQSKDVKFIEGRNKLLFSSSVNVTDDQNRFLSANTGEYNLKTKFLNLEDNVEYLGNISKIHSEKLRSDQIVNTSDGKKDLVYFFERNIRFSYQTFEGTSDRLMVNTKRGTTKLIGNVKLKGKNNNLSIKSDIALISEKDKKSRFYNNVHFQIGEQNIYSNTASFDDRTGIFTLMGRARYHDATNQYEAQKIYLDSKTLSIRFVGMASGLSSLGKLEGIQIENSKG